MSTRAFVVATLLIVCARAVADNGPRYASYTEPSAAEHRAADDVPVVVPSTRTAVYRQRLRDLEAWVHDLARNHPVSRTTNVAKFCGAFSDWDMQGTISSLWSELSRGPRHELIAQLVGLVDACQFSQGSAKRAAFVIDYLYWNRLADTTGYEVADTLVVRDVLHEIYINQLAQDLIARNAEVVATKAPPPAHDFLTAGPMHRIGLAKHAAAVADALAPEERRSFDAMLDVVNFREGYLEPFGNDTMQILRTPDDLRALEEVVAYLQRVQQNPKLLGERHGGWHALMKITRNRPEQATRVLGVMASLLYMPLEDLGAALATRGELTTDAVAALHDGTMAYYLINQLDERSAKTSTDDDHSLVYHFFYPDDVETTNWKWYHWYNNAHLGCVVARRGHAKDAVVGAARLLGKFYEAATLNLVIPARNALGLDPRANAILESYEDVELNARGAAYGAELCKPRTP